MELDALHCMSTLPRMPVAHTHPHPQGQQTKTSPHLAKCPLEGKNHSQLRTTNLPHKNKQIKILVK